MDFSGVHLHLAINHSPLFAELFALCLILFGLLKKRREFVTAALVVSIVAALCAIASDLTGDKAADFVSHANPPIAGLDKTLIKEHDLAAGFCVISSCITGVAAIIALFLGYRRGSRPRWLEIVIAILIAWALSVAGRTALLGGRIHHEEVRALAVHTP
ncbi:MAG: hypothetical protein QOE82_2629 [Thermoanaerobaculia bacterium]|jgi:peptidoglycan/LPS O-acetylase OafA/YrhL|nr:hypothetical protein [Thermoanaerobaculia bacterium]